MESGRVLSLGESDVSAAGNVVARAFDTDELHGCMYPDGETRGRCGPILFETIVRYDQLFGRVDYLDGFRAVASWMQPGEVETPEKLAQAGFNNLPDEVELEPLDKVFSFVGPAIAAVQTDPHWHLRLLAVDPAYQGGGLGAELMRHGIERARGTGHAVVLETFSQRAMRFYLRNGFDTIVDAVEPTTGLRFWALQYDA